jgi:hypothetical protein
VDLVYVEVWVHLFQGDFLREEDARPIDVLNSLETSIGRLVQNRRGKHAHAANMDHLNKLYLNPLILFLLHSSKHPPPPKEALDPGDGFHVCGQGVQGEDDGCAGGFDDE